MVKITFLGCHAYQTENKDTTSFIIETEKKSTILIETGPSVVKQLNSAHYNTLDIDTIFISHSHADHCLGFPYLLFMRQTERILKNLRTEKEVKVLTLPEVSKKLKEMTEFCYPSTGLLADVEFIDIQKDSFHTSLEDLEVITSKVEHSVPTLGIRFEFPSCIIAYTSDTIYCKNAVKIAEDADLLICEAIVPSNMDNLAKNMKHGSTLDAIKIAQDSEAKRVALVHMLPAINDEVFIKDVKQLFKGEVFIPIQYESIELK